MLENVFNQTIISFVSNNSMTIDGGARLVYTTRQVAESKVTNKPTEGTKQFRIGEGGQLERHLQCLYHILGPGGRAVSVSDFCLTPMTPFRIRTTANSLYSPNGGLQSVVDPFVEHCTLLVYIIMGSRKNLLLLHL